MTIVTFIAVYPSVLVLEWLTQGWFEGWPLPLRTLVLPVVLSPLLTYAIMPFLSRVLRPFLYVDQ
jgi:antibiotic biosynthesis monooxygenase (ABM) superfamily enzyme